MNREKLQKRIHVLTDVFSWSLIHKKLSRGKRICITQERVALMELLDFPDRELRYKIPPHLEVEVKKISETIRLTRWQKPVYKSIF